MKIQIAGNSSENTIWKTLFRNFCWRGYNHGSHGPGILFEKLLGPWKLLENDFLLENSLNLKKQCLNFMQKSLIIEDTAK